MKWRNRINDNKIHDVNPEDLLANPKNARLHNQMQQTQMTDILERLGWVTPVIVSEATNFVLDGHMRIVLAIRHKQPTVPVIYVKVTEQEENLVLAFFDRVGDLAYWNTNALDDLINSLILPSTIYGNDSELERAAKEKGVTVESLREATENLVNQVEPQADRVTGLLESMFGYGSEDYLTELPGYMKPRKQPDNLPPASTGTTKFDIMHKGLDVNLHQRYWQVFTKLEGDSELAKLEKLVQILEKELG